MLGDCTLLKCRYLRSVTFAPGSELEEIGAECFSATRIETITIPKGVANIWAGAFYKCEGLREVTFEKESRLRTIRSNLFINCESPHSRRTYKYMVPRVSLL